MAKWFPCLWFDGNAEEAANFYVTLLPDSHVDKVWRSPAETPARAPKRCWNSSSRPTSFPAADACSRPCSPLARNGRRRNIACFDSGVPRRERPTE
jgi:hypothetical protein